MELSRSPLPGMLPPDCPASDLCPANGGVTVEDKDGDGLITLYDVNPDENGRARPLERWRDSLGVTAIGIRAGNGLCCCALSG